MMSHNGQSGSNSERTGPIAWMAANPVAANLVMLVLVVGGTMFLFSPGQIKREVFPTVDLDMVAVQVPYPGATPAEVEQGIIIPIEEAIREVDGIDEIRATAREGMASIQAELLTNVDTQTARNDIESAISRITSFPEDVEDPVVSIPTNRQQVLSIMMYGDIDLKRLRQLGEMARMDLLQKDKISVVNVEGLPPPEISIEVPQKQLRRYNLTLQQVAKRVRAASVEMPGGTIETKGGEILLRTTEEREVGTDFEDISIISRPDGTRVTLDDIGRIEDEFRDTDRATYFNGKPALRVQVYRIGDQGPVEVSKAAREYLETLRTRLPESVETQIWNDASEIYEDRINLLLRNSFYGLILVLLVLGLFLEPRLAFWVTLGIPISFMGAVFLMPSLGVSINMISLFAFLLTLGIVVDDAIVIGEATFKHKRKGKTAHTAAVDAVYEVGAPVIFAVLTTIIAFSPLLFVPGMMGKFFSNIPMIVIPIFLFSLVECLIILPAHLAHDNALVNAFAFVFGAISRPLVKLQEAFSKAVEAFVDKVYRPIAQIVLEFRYVTLASSIALLAIGIGYIKGGFIKINFFPKIEGDIATAKLEMPVGTPAEKTRNVMNQLVKHAQQVIDKNGAENGGLAEGIMAELGNTGGILRSPRPSAGGGGSHIAQVGVQLVAPNKRKMSAQKFTELWREGVGDVPGIDTLSFSYDIGPGVGADVAVELRHEDRSTLKRAAERLADKLETYNGVYNIDDGFQQGKQQISLKLKPSARSLGLTEADLARQINSAYFGAEAKRDQRGREELRIYVRRPESERTSEHDLESMILKTPTGGEIPLEQAASLSRGRSYTEIERENGNRSVEVTANINPGVTTGGRIMGNLKQDVLPKLKERFSGLSWEKSGKQQERQEAMGALKIGLIIALLVMYSLMAIAFRSYIQPFVIMCAIPFGLLGAMAGHIVMGYSISMVSFMGMAALAGVVVNDTLVLISRVNDRRREGATAEQALVDGGADRFRPIVLTSLTTFFGLAPMITETSIQAKFLIPMAISLGFGVLFVTVIALIIVPTIYMFFEDLNRGVQATKHWINSL